MNRKELLLSHLMEEAAEVQKVCSKIQRFGLHGKKYEDGLDNKEKLFQEVADFKAILSIA